jgi:hypothetical protein
MTAAVQQHSPVAKTYRLAHGPAVAILGAVISLFFIGIAAASNIYPNGTATIWTTLSFLGFAGLALILVVAHFRDWHIASDEGLNYARLFVGRRDLKWRDVISVRYSRNLHCLGIKASNGTAYISAIIGGKPVLSHLILAHVSASAIDPEIRPLLEASAETDDSEAS